MTVRAVVNAASTAYLTAAFAGKTGAAATPSSVSYRIDDLESGTEVRGDTAVTPAASVEIELTAADNALLGTRDRETRRVTVTAVYGAGDQVIDEYDYELKRVRFG